MLQKLACINTKHGKIIHSYKRLVQNPEQKWLIWETCLKYEDNIRKDLTNMDHEIMAVIELDREMVQ